MSIFEELLRAEEMPLFYKVHYEIPAVSVGDVEAAVRAAVHRKESLSAIQMGDTVAITAGSREISNIALIIKTLVEEVKQAGGVPFIVPAMGSHGGAVAEGQTKILHDYGITEEYVGAPIRSSMETVCLGKTKEHGFEVHLDKNASEADWIIPVGRIKPHTDIKGPIQSGLMKMLVIGLGKQEGAAICHANGFLKMSENIVEIGKVILDKAPILFGLAILENGHHDTYRIEAVASCEFLKREEELLKDAKRQLPCIPFEKLDMLVVDQMGKDISGAGMDPNITGRSSIHGISEPNIERIVVRDLTENSHHNASGIGNADVIPQRMYDKINLEETYPNCITSCDVAGFKLPVIMPDDRLAFKLALHTITEASAETGYRIMWIQDTNHLQTFYITERLLEEAKKNPALTVEEQPLEVVYDADGYVEQFKAAGSE